jgi:hypothetical protein
MMEFHGDFEFLPIKSDLLFGPVPLYPTDSDFHLAASTVAANPDEPAAYWRMEAIRARRGHSCAKLDELMPRIMAATAQRLFQVVTAD